MVKRSGIGHFQDRRRDAGASARLRRDADHRHAASGASPADRAEALATLRRLPELGINFIDTADSYGPDVSEELIREALAPLRRHRGRDQGGPDAHRAQPVDPARAAGISDPAGACEPAPARRREHRPLAAAPHRSARCRATSSSRAIKSLIDDKVIRHAGLSEVSVEEIEAARRSLPGRDRAEPLQSRRPRQRGRARLLREARHRLHPVVSAGGGRSGASRAARSTRSRKRTRRRPGRSRSRGC